jgi:hypothetical protein
MVKIVINIKDGLIDLEAEPEQLEQATASAIRLIERLSSAPVADTRATVLETPKVDPSRDHFSDAEQAGVSGAASSEKSKGRRRKGAGKTKNWEFKPELLQDSDWVRVRDFVAVKSPSTQNEKVAVFVSILSQILGRKAFDGHELHTCFKTLTERTPANLTGVLGNMAAEGLGHTSEGKFQLDFAGNQLVDHDLPRVKSAKK